MVKWGREVSIVDEGVKFLLILYVLSFHHRLLCLPPTTQMGGTTLSPKILMACCEDIAFPSHVRYYFVS
jgi:hypothetical protein